MLTINYDEIHSLKKEVILTNSKSNPIYKII